LIEGKEANVVGPEEKGGLNINKKERKKTKGFQNRRERKAKIKEWGEVAD